MTAAFGGSGANISSFTINLDGAPAWTLAFPAHSRLLLSLFLSPARQAIGRDRPWRPAHPLASP